MSEVNTKQTLKKLVRARVITDLQRASKRAKKGISDRSMILALCDYIESIYVGEDYESHLKGFLRDFFPEIQTGVQGE